MQHPAFQLLTSLSMLPGWVEPGFPPLWILLNGLVTGWAGHSTLFVLERVWSAGLGGAELCVVSGWKSNVRFAKMGGWEGKYENKHNL